MIMIPFEKHPSLVSSSSIELFINSNASGLVFLIIAARIFSENVVPVHQMRETLRYKDQYY
jgi:hypothetical protein